MSGSGSTDLGSGATMYVLGTAAGDDNRYLLGRTFNNAGTIIWTGIRPIVTDDNGATFNNLASGTILARSDSGFVNQDVNSSLGVTFNNAGTLRKEVGTGVMLFDVGTFNNSGTVEAQTGTVRIADGTGVSTGRFSLAAGAVLDVGGGTQRLGGALSLAAGATLAFTGGMHNLTGSSTVSGPGTVRFSGGVANLAGAYNITGLTQIDGGIANFNADSATTLARLSGGVLAGTGTLTVSGVFEWSSGTLSGTGSVTIPSSAILSLNSEGQKYLDGRTLRRYGQTIWSGTGLIIRVMADRTTEPFTNAYIYPPGAAGFDASADASTLYRAMYGGLTGWGTDEDAIYRTLEGKTSEQLAAIRQAYQSHYAGPGCRCAE